MTPATILGTTDVPQKEFFEMRHDTQTAEVASDQEVEKVEQTEPIDRQLIPSDWPKCMRYYNESQMA